VAYVVLSDPGRYFSVDAWRRSRADPRVSALGIGMGPGWPMRLVQVQVCAMYAITGINRLDKPGWLAGTMLYAALTNRVFGRFDIDWTSYVPLLRILSYGTFLIEPLAPIMLWIPRIGPWWAVGLLALHMGLEVATTVGWWSFMMCTGLLTFLPPRWLERGHRGILRLLGRPPA